jgi:hypothetical protein
MIPGGGYRGVRLDSILWECMFVPVADAAAGTVTATDGPGQPGIVWSMPRYTLHHESTSTFRRSRLDRTRAAELFPEKDDR